MTFIRKQKKHNFIRKQKNLGGRPKKYTDEWLTNEAQIFDKWVASKTYEPFMWYKDFAISRGYDPSRLCEFAKASKVFSASLSRAKKVQESKILEGGITGKLNPTFSMFLLKCKFGYNDGNVRKILVGGDKDNPVKSEHTTTVVDKSPVLKSRERVGKVLDILKTVGALDTIAEPDPTEIN